MTAHRKAMASLRMVRIRRVQDRIAMQSVHAASDLVAQVQNQSERINTIRDMILPDLGQYDAADIAARLDMATRLSVAQSQLRAKEKLLLSQYCTAQEQQLETHRALRSAEKFAAASAQALDAEIAARTQREARPKTRQRP